MILDELAERHPTVEKYLIPLFVVAVGIVIAFFQRELGIAIIGVGLGSNADLRYLATNWFMRSTHEDG